MKHKSVLLGLVLLLISNVGNAVGCSEEDLRLLDAELLNKANYEVQKRQQIQATFSQYVDEYSLDSALFEVYKSYSYDTAFIYANLLLDAAQLQADSSRILHAQLNLAFAYLSAAFFKESSDIFASISLPKNDSAFLSQYYAAYARLYYDLADFCQGADESKYIAEGNRMSQMALNYLSPTDTLHYWSVSALYAMKQRDYYLALDRFHRVLSYSNIGLHEQAIVHSSIASIYYFMGDTAHAAHSWVNAAIADLRSATKETTAMYMIAELCHLSGDSEHADAYIRYALDDATFYHAKHRQLSVSRLLPIIEGQQIRQLQQQNHFIRIQNILLLLLTLLTLVGFVLAWKHSRDAHRAQQAKQGINTQLIEANRIKEECLGTFVTTESGVYSILDRYQRFVRHHLQENQTKELQNIPKWANTHALRADFYRRFDTMVWRIYPHLSEEYYAGLDKNSLPILPNDELNAELRIWALMRLGITDDKQIANILDYSINTIYTYKTRIRNDIAKTKQSKN